MTRFFPKCPGLPRRLIALLAIAGLTVATTARADGTAILLELDGALGVATAEYIIGGIEDAEDSNANLVIIRMDTPGGLMEPMRDIVQAMLNEKLPIAFPGKELHVDQERKNLRIHGDLSLD